MSPQVGRETAIPENRIVRVSVLVRNPGYYCPDPVDLKKRLSKKYPVEQIELVARNPPEPGGSIRLFVVAYLLKEIFGPTLKQMVKDLYKYAKQQILKKTSRLTLPPGFIYNGHNGTTRKKRRRKKRKAARATK